ncbi:DUF1353 domain-containing protein [Endozoicomonas sp. ONNA1]|uniref:DUF1353 domain-containing protein n=1 Tax=Endozoicomonas sp. ONNA1 TaxID=2828740 RepID=UPI00214997AC|nr:DUF1353 domain-containing protein [Endozoicomonas sp. ONNA1]
MKTKQWIYVLEKDFTIYTDLVGYSFSNPWMRLESNGLLFIKKGYAWDGCTPKLFNFFDLFYLGTPEGIIDNTTNKPKTYYASLVHDALYQWADDNPISKTQADDLFLKMLSDCNFKMAKLYRWVVGWGGDYTNLN